MKSSKCMVLFHRNILFLGQGFRKATTIIYICREQNDRNIYIQGKCSRLSQLRRIQKPVKHLR